MQFLPSFRGLPKPTKTLNEYCGSALDRRGTLFQYMDQRRMALVLTARGFVRWLKQYGETSVNDPKVKGNGQRTQYSSYGQL
ncbi:hypothetical protein AVEN_43786-1 [Araneus ventricosus]|uniref:Uncharacterized protein n=1 Tax=Araneus ventricosus TaxID=182803 RepID=A0A4Y2SQA6_ARAVE|nr:hypothetical protein AVEN_43786-1 [Araneus ventricosus]